MSWLFVYLKVTVINILIIINIVKQYEMTTMWQYEKGVFDLELYILVSYYLNSYL